MTQSRRKSIIALAVTALALFCGVMFFLQETSAFQNEKYSKAVGAYSGHLAYDFGGGKAYAIGVNAVGDPVFKKPQEAFHQCLIDYRAGFHEIQKQNHLLPVNSLNWRDYGTYGWQTWAKDDNVRKQCAHISQFFDIYENSFG